MLNKAGVRRKTTPKPPPCEAGRGLGVGMQEKSPMTRPFEVYHTQDAAAFEAIRARVRAYNRQQAPAAFNESRDELPLLVVARADDETIIGGAAAQTYWESGFLNDLSVCDDQRGSGLGSALLSRLEAEVRARGGKFVWLTTFDFQALGFYQKHGYRVVGQMDDFPPGHTLYTLRKDL
jgi:GNAT superfamily N-acetyltransferase